MVSYLQKPLRVRHVLGLNASKQLCSLLYLVPRSYTEPLRQSRKIFLHVILMLKNYVQQYHWASTDTVGLLYKGTIGILGLA